MCVIAVYARQLNNVHHATIYKRRDRFQRIRRIITPNWLVFKVRSSLLVCAMPSSQCASPYAYNSQHADQIIDTAFERNRKHVIESHACAVCINTVLLCGDPFVVRDTLSNSRSQTTETFRMITWAAADDNTVDKNSHSVCSCHAAYTMGMLITFVNDERSADHTRVWRQQIVVLVHYHANAIRRNA